MIARVSLRRAADPGDGRIRRAAGRAPVPATSSPSGGTEWRICARAAHPTACARQRSPLPAIRAAVRGFSLGPACRMAARRDRTNPAGRQTNQACRVAWVIALDFYIVRRHPSRQSKPKVVTAKGGGDRLGQDLVRSVEPMQQLLDAPGHIEDGALQLRVQCLAVARRQPARQHAIAADREAPYPLGQVRNAQRLGRLAAARSRRPYHRRKTHVPVAARRASRR